MTQLKNGSTLILEELTIRQDSKVLAQTERDFVTWLKDNKGNCYNGHYHPHTLAGLRDAVEDFHHRQ